MMNFMLDEQRYVALVGLPGCGKTTFAARLAQEMGLKQIDNDDLIVEMSGKTIPELFAESEETFRDWEEKALASIRPDSNLVVACGGGIIKRESCRSILKRNAIVVYIERSPEKICADVDTSGRPLLKEGAEKIYRLYDAETGKTLLVVHTFGGSLPPSIRIPTGATAVEEVLCSENNRVSLSEGFVEVQLKAGFEGIAVVLND